MATRNTKQNILHFALVKIIVGGRSIREGILMSPTK